VCEVPSLNVLHGEVARLPPSTVAKPPPSIPTSVGMNGPRERVHGSGVPPGPRLRSVPGASDHRLSTPPSVRSGFVRERRPPTCHVLEASLTVCPAIPSAGAVQALCSRRWVHLGACPSVCRDLRDFKSSDENRDSDDCNRRACGLAVFDPPAATRRTMLVGMASKRTLLELLSRDDLLAAVDLFSVEVPDRRARRHRGRPGGLAQSQPGPSLADFRATPEGPGRSLGLDDAGREKTALIDA